MKYYKISFICFVVSLFTVACNSDVPVSQMQEGSQSNVQKAVSIDDARNSMFDMVALVGGVKSRSNGRAIASEYEIRVCLPARASSDGRRFYVFNFENDGGFAIMTADEQPSSLIALTEQGNLVPNEPIDNPGLVMLLSNAGSDNSNGDSEYIVFKNDQPVARWANAPVWETMRPSSFFDREFYQWNYSADGGGIVIAPKVEFTVEYTDYEVINEVPSMCPARWGQDSPFNSSLPAVSGGSLPKAGSLAVAVGQIMCAYRYPVTFDGDTLPWSKMEPAHPMLDGTFDIYTRRIRSRLIKKLGDADNLDMHYGRDYSYASPENVARTFTSFGYANGGEVKTYDSKEVMAEVKNGYISIIGGTPTESQDDKHFWIVDGCKEVTRIANVYNANHELVDTVKMIAQYLQCNWGSKGRNNGYYSVDMFDAKVGLPKQIVWIENTDSNTIVIPTPYIEGDELDNYKYNLQSITGIRK